MLTQSLGSGRGSNSIQMFAVDRQTGHLAFISDNESPRAGDGPRHVVVSSDGNMLYSVTEHSRLSYNSVTTLCSFINFS